MFSDSLADLSLPRSSRRDENQIPKIARPEAYELILGRAVECPPSFGLRQSSGAFGGGGASKSGRGLPQSTTLPRHR
jgi:hypothetical protein